MGWIARSVVTSCVAAGLCTAATLALAAEPSRPDVPATPRVAPVDPATASPGEKAALDHLEPALRRLNVVRTMLRNPKLHEAWQPFAYYVLRQSTLPARDRELLILRIGWLNGSTYEFTQHVRVAKNAGVTDAEVAGVKEGPGAAAWPPFERALLEAVDALREKSSIPDATWATLAARYDEAQLMDVVVTTGQYNLISWYLNALGTPLEEGVAPQSMTR